MSIAFTLNGEPAQSPLDPQTPLPVSYTHLTLPTKA